MTAWCSGAPGIALALASMLTVGTDPEMPHHFERALQTTLDSIDVDDDDPFEGDGSFCLCHGNAGNADIVLTIAERVAWTSPTMLLGPTYWRQRMTVAARTAAKVRKGMTVIRNSRKAVPGGLGICGSFSIG